MPPPPKNLRSIDGLRQIMRALRAPEGGCPWDVEQTFRTIAPYTVEEAHEVADAIERDDMNDLREELGDLLFQTVFHAQMAEEAGAFTFDDICEAICTKMLGRHPHVFGDGHDRDAAGQEQAWEVIKRQERAEKAAKHDRAPGVLDDVPAGLPPMLRALKIQKRLADVGFEWPDAKGVVEKVAEEAEELAEAAETGQHDDIEGELGDLLFVIMNVARRYKLDPDAALRRTNQKVINRFGAVEAALRAEGRTPDAASLEEMDALWVRAKQQKI